MDLVSRSSVPYCWAKLQHLSAATGGVVNSILRPSDYLTEVVGPGCKTVISPWERGKPPHLIVLPDKAEIDISDIVRCTVEGRATPGLSVRLGIGGLRNADDNSRRIFHIPRDTAVWSAKCAEVGEQAVSPQRGVPIPIHQP